MTGEDLKLNMGLTASQIGPCSICSFSLHILVVW